MSVRSMTKRAIAIGGATVLIGGLAACSSGGSADEGGGKVEITYQADNAPATAATAKPLIEAFEKANPDITVKFDTRPQGTDGDNLIKTRLSTGEAADVFNYNSGSLMQALNPDNTLVDLSEEKWAGDVDPQFTKVVSTDKGMYGAPFGTSFGGAVLYNTKVYDDLGLKVPTTWDEFVSNSEKIKDAGDVAPIIRPTATPGPASCSSSATSRTSPHRTRSGRTTTPPTRSPTPTNPHSPGSSTSPRARTRTSTTRTTPRPRRRTA